MCSACSLILESESPLMNFEPSQSEPLNFEPTSGSYSFDVSANFVVEASIVRTIVEGSGGPENHEITDIGLRFVRHLLTQSRSMRFGFMPNFKNMDSIREMAREFIRRSGSASVALQTMYAVTQGLE